MPQIFHPATNYISKVSIVLILVGLGGLVWAGAELSVSGYTTGQGVILNQPVPFSHDHHFAGLGIHCLYCHTSVETSAFAGVPPVATCMNCHRQIWTNAHLLEPVRQAYRTGVPIQWERVHDLPDFVFFNHSVHLAKGIGCESCHGRVDRMPLIWREATLQMSWCLDCHRAPEKYVRPRERVFEMGWQPQEDQLTLGRKLVNEYKIQKLTDCYTCHR
jgi:hypothetical protein